MTRIVKKVSTLSVLVLSLFLWSCDNIGNTTMPDSDLNPHGYAIFSTATGQQFVVIREAEALGVVSGTIGAAGGQLYLGDHSLYVPAGAVSEPTVFTMSRTTDDIVRFQLSATRQTYNDVGSAGFAVPVQLTISFAGADDLPAENVSELKVIYFRPDGLVDPQGTSLKINDRTATGQLGHFSDFGLAWPRTR